MPKASSQFDSNGYLRLESGLLLHNSGVARGEFRSLHADFFQSETSINTGDASGLIENEEFAEFNFRMLSAVLIPGWWTDLRKPGVLESAVKLFATKIYTDHQRTVRNAIGITRNPVFTNRNGTPGIDSVFRIFKAFGLDVIARLKTLPALIDANSVGITFTYEKSHPQLENFYERLGEVVDGQIVRLIVTKILSIPETSLVAIPADDTARKFTEFDFPNSNLLNPNSNNQEDRMKIKRAFLSLLGVDSQKFGLSSGEGESVELPSEKMESVLEEAGKTIAKLQDQARQSAVLQNNLNQFAKLFGSDTFPENVDFASKVTELKTLLEEPKKLLSAEREKAVTAFRAFSKNNPDPVIEGLIQGANLEQAKAFLKQYGASLENSHPLKCEDCGSKKISRASGSFSEPQGGEISQKKANPNSFKLSKK
ncbi:MULTISPECIES: hypothetical protein [unclassified Leptospira]|uniref:hypothetical protein n=1 Tax=unclassified Leptospira TaxID=2633828 RepID=UPI0002BDD7EA|nr:MULTISPECIES: hypothetical protein [unclassified Leptospira]EMI65283.1 hypothetical protein LEP1GSC076_1666 [Leptospira sp. Fiocruz LV4135]